jgi:2-keto-4-pentenoate hydratase/2-oxohepta-3-ene-1,7-dioic acid hydratase in catechol pathway
VKIARYRFKHEESYGKIDQQCILSLPALAESENVSLPKNFEEFIAEQNAQETAEILLKKAKPCNATAASVPIKEAQVLAPIIFPPKIVCLGWNYVDHVAERKVPRPEEPVFFMKPHTAIVGPGDEIMKRPFVKELDYEGELAVVIGKKAKDVPVAEANDFIFGYTILNDISARDFQFKDKQWTRGKGFDTFAPTGPCITTKKQLPNTENLSVRTWVNGDLRQDGTTCDMIFNVAQIIYHLSRVMTLEPCDIISTGTPSGVAMGMKEPKWLKNGDTVKIEIEGIGTLENMVKEA